MSFMVVKRRLMECMINYESDLKLIIEFYLNSMIVLFYVILFFEIRFDSIKFLFFEKFYEGIC